MPIKKYVRKGRKYAKKGYKKVIHPYVNKKKGYNNRMKLYKEVQTIKRLINPEKKRFDSTITSPGSVGQTNGVGTSGAYVANLTPIPAQGLTGSTRIGNSYKIVSAAIDMQVYQDTLTNNAVRLRWLIVCKPDNGQDTSASTMIQQLFEANPFSTVIDYHSNRDPEYFQDYRILRSGRIYLKNDEIASQTSYAQRKILLRLALHQKFNTDASTVTTRNKIWLVLLADTGDVTATTGAKVLYNARFYYVDN